MAKQGSGVLKNVILAVLAVACLGGAGYLFWWQFSGEKPQRAEPTGTGASDPYAQVPDEVLRQMAAEGKFSEEDLARFRAQGRLPAE